MVFAAGHAQNAHGFIRHLRENLDRPLRCGGAGRVGIVGDDDFVGRLGQHPRLLLGQRRSQRGDGVAEAGLMQRDDVHIAFRQNYFAGTGFFGELIGVEVAFFIEDRRVARVEIFLSLALPAQYAAAKADDVPLDVDNREHQAVAERVVNGALALFGEPGLHQLMLGKALAFEELCERVPCVGRIADAEFPHRRGGQRAPPDVFNSLARVLRGQLVKVKAGGEPVGFQNPLPHADNFFVLILRKLHIVHLRQELDGLFEFQPLDIHDELHDAAALAAAETVIELFFRVDGKRRRFFTVERAERPQPVAAACELRISGNDLRKVGARGELIEKLRRKTRHSRRLLSKKSAFGKPYVPVNSPSRRPRAVSPALSGRFRAGKPVSKAIGRGFENARDRIDTDIARRRSLKYMPVFWNINVFKNFNRITVGHT